MEECSAGAQSGGFIDLCLPTIPSVTFSFGAVALRSQTSFSLPPASYFTDFTHSSSYYVSVSPDEVGKSAKIKHDLKAIKGPKNKCKM